jgi:ectoine hydroxylase-related dioxygenase (phytanoyl-CoA dioxygenase family)
LKDQVAGAGYSIERSVFSNAECDALIAALADVSIKRSRAGIRHLMANAVVSALAADRRLLAIADKELGTRAIPFRATLFDKSWQANWLVAWHQDTALPLASKFDAPGWGPWSEKAGILYAHAPEWALSRILALRVYLDQSTNEKGPLRVVPGSHRGVLTDEGVREYVQAHAQVDCPAPQGGVLTMRPLLIHASSKSQSRRPRRVLHIEYIDSVDLKPGIKLAIA